MRKAYGVIGVVTVLAALSWMVSSGVAREHSAAAYSGSCDCCNGGGCGLGCGCGLARCLWLPGGHYAAVGYDACACKGSYKFPVPPQYTYHWPGMYSQQTMSQYNSPYRFPMLLKSPDVLDDATDVPATVSPTRQAAYAETAAGVDR